jgi:hypothetical protein
MANRYLIFVSVVALIGVLAISAWIDWAGPGDAQVAMLEATLERYRLAGCLAPPEGIAGTIPPHAVPAEGLDALGEVYLWNCVQRINDRRRTRLKGLVFNGRIAPDAVNVYLLKHDPERAFSQFHNNCAYVGRATNLIICDATYLTGLQHEPPWLRELSQRPFKELEARLRKRKDWQEPSPASVQEWKEVIENVGLVNNRQVLLWVLGHEMGHMANDDRALHATFAGDEDKLLIRYFDARYRTEETQADQFAVDAVSDPLLAAPLAVGLQSAIDRFGTMLLVREGHEEALWTNDTPIIIKNDSQTHPPLFLRALTMLMTINTKYHRSSENIESLKKRVIIRN